MPPLNQASKNSLLRGVTTAAAGTLGTLHLVLPQTAAQLWGGSVSPSYASSMAGSMWLAVAILCFFMKSSTATAAIATWQLLYKSIFLLSVVPAYMNNEPIPWLFVTAWVGWIAVLLPLVAPWGEMRSLVSGKADMKID